MDPSTFTEGRAPAIAADPHRRQSQQAYRHVFRAQPASLNDQSPLAPASTGGITTDSTTTAWYDHSSGHRTNTDAFLAYHLSLQYPQLELVVTPQYLCDLLAFAAAGKASFKFLNTETIKVGKMGDLRQIANEGQPRSSAVFGEAPSAHMHTIWMPPSKRMDGGQGVLALDLQFGRLLYRYKDEEFLVYIADTTYGGASYGTPMCYILSPDRLKAEELVAACGRWSNDLHEEVWVFDQGYWQKSRDLYRSVAEASWDNVILDPDMKRSLIQDHMSFYNSRETYRRLKVPWKRGIIYYGPPGNGKTISVKAMMNMLSKQPDPIPTLYVRTLAGFSGPEYSIKQIFGKARQFAPCYLVFEDLDTIVTDSVRSYFLNEVDGLAANDGILIIGSTNHLDRLDPGIAKRPARFDRKYLFPDPGRKERVMYAQFWQGKLKSNKAIAFPDELCGKMADITDGFSFAYLQEAFVATLMAIASSQADEQNVWTEVRSCDTSSVQKAGCPDGTPTSDDITDGIRHLMKTRFGLNPRSQCAAPETQGDSDWFHVEDDEAEFGDGGDGNDLDDLVFWVEFQKQVAILREGMERDA